MRVLPSTIISLICLVFTTHCDSTSSDTETSDGETGGSNATATGSDSSTDSSTDSTTDNTTTTDSTTSTSTDSNPLCPEYSGFAAVNNYWIYEDETYSGEWTRQIVTMDDSTGDITTAETFIYESSGYTTTTTMTGSYRCTSEGFWMLSYSSTYDVTDESNNVITTGFSDVVYDGPLLTLPVDIDVDSSWYVQGSYTATTNSGTFDQSFSYLYQAVDMEEITVTAGTFDTLYIEVTDTSTSATSSYWTNADIGMIITGGYELVEYGQ